MPEYSVFINGRDEYHDVTRGVAFELAMTALYNKKGDLTRGTKIEIRHSYKGLVFSAKNP